MVVAEDGTLLLRAPQFVEGLFLIDLPVTGVDTSTGPPRMSQPEGAGMTVDLHATGPMQSTAFVDESPTPVHRWEPRQTTLAEVWRATCSRSRLRRLRRHKNGFRSVVIALSGGIDSAVVAAIAADAVGGENVFGVSMPSKYLDHPSICGDAADLARAGRRALSGAADRTDGRRVRR